MVRPLSQVNRLKVKTLKGNSMGLNLVGIRNMLKKDIVSHESDDVLSSDKRTTDELNNSKPNDITFIWQTDPVLNRKKTSYDTFFHDESQGQQIKRRYRMRDKFGNLCRVKVNRRETMKTTSLKPPKRDSAEQLNRLVLNIRCFKIGTFTKIFRCYDTLTPKCTFTVDYIEIANEVRIKVSEITNCEWCTVKRLPSLFLQTTPTASNHLQAQIINVVCEDDSRVWYDCQSKNQEEKYIVLIFEKELTFSEQLILEEILTKIGTSNNTGSFPVKLSFEEAYSRLKTQSRAPKQQITEIESEEDELPVMIQQASVTLLTSPDSPRSEIATLSVSDSDEDLFEVPSSPILEIKKLVVYPPPPAKGSISITEEDLSCLEEGQFLNDVIVDFYLRFLVCQQLRRPDPVGCHVFSSFFFKHLSQEDQRRTTESAGLSIQELRHNRVKTWTRHVNIFEKDFIFVPINQRAHWYLAVICFPGRVSHTIDSDVSVSGYSAEYIYDQSPPNPMSLFYHQESKDNQWSALNTSFWFISSDDDHDDDDDDDSTTGIQAFENTRVLSSKSNAWKRPCILIMDSLYSRARSTVVQILQEYLQEEWRVKKGCWQSFGSGVMEGWSPRVPQQDNFTDCGVYLLQYVETFLKDPPQAFHPNMDLKDWFSQKTVKRKRQQIKRLILKLHREQNL